jgi:hypothetical protein
MNDYNATAVPAGIDPGSVGVSSEEFFEKTLFDDVFEMKSILEVSEKTAFSLKDLQDEVYQTLFDLFQKTRGINTPSSKSSDEMFGIFELFFKTYYQHFRSAMEDLIVNESPVKVAYYLGKNTDRLLVMLDQFVQEVEREIR